MKEESESLLENRFATACVQAGVRADGRGLMRARRTRVTLGERWGDAQVWLERTRAAATASVTAITPAPERPAEGSVIITVELSPASGEAAARMAASGARSEAGAALRASVERVVRDSRALDVDALCIVAGARVWAVRVHVDVLADDGNALDAAVLAAAAALLHARRPDVTVSGRDVIVHSPDEREPLPLPVHHVPIAVSFALFRAVDTEADDVSALDPTRREMLAAAGALTLACNAQGEVCAVQKAGGLPLASALLVECAKVAEKRAIELTKVLADALKDAAMQHPLATARPLMSNPEPVAVLAPDMPPPNVDKIGEGAGAWNEAAENKPAFVEPVVETVVENGAGMDVEKWPSVGKSAGGRRKKRKGKKEKEDGEISSQDGVINLDAE